MYHPPTTQSFLGSSDALRHNAMSTIATVMLSEAVRVYFEDRQRTWNSKPILNKRNEVCKSDDMLFVPARKSTTA